MKKIILLLICFCTLNSIAQTSTTIKNGNWGDVTTWDNGVPGWGNNAIVNHNISLNAAVSLGSGDLLVNAGASLIQIGSFDISIWDNAGSFTNHGTVTANIMNGSGTYFNDGTLNLVSIDISSPASLSSTGSLTLSGDMNIGVSVNASFDGTVDIGGVIQLDNFASITNNAVFNLTGNFSMNDNSSFTTNNTFTSNGDIWAGISSSITNNSAFTINNYNGEADLINNGTMNFNDINSAYADGSITNNAGCSMILSGMFRSYNNTDVTNDGTIQVAAPGLGCVIGGNQFINNGSFTVSNNATSFSANLIENHGNLTLHNVNGQGVFHNYKNFYVTNNIDDFYGINEFHNHTGAHAEITGFVEIWNDVFVNDGYIFVGGNVTLGSGLATANNTNVFVCKGAFTNDASFNNNGAIYCIGTGDFINNWSHYIQAASCGHVNVGCNDFIDRGAVTNMNIYGNYIKEGGTAAVNMSTLAWLPCSGLDIEYYSRADGNWEDADACSGLCVWSLEQIKPDPINEYPKIYENVTIDNHLITVNNATTPQPISCDSLALKPLGKLTIDNTKTLTVNGDFIINSPENSGATGSLLDNGTINITGIQKVQRYITGMNWHYFGSPVDEFNGGDFFQSNFYYYNETTNDTWTGDNIFGTYGWTNPGTGNLSADMRGYIYYYENDMLEFQGNLNTGAKNNTLSYTNNNPSNPEFDGWNLICNPYPSAIDIDAITTTGIIDNCIYFYDDDGSSPYYNNYRYYIKGGVGANPYPAISVNGGQQYIPVAQAFFVRTTTNNQSFDLDTDLKTTCIKNKLNSYALASKTITGRFDLSPILAILIKKQ